MSRTITIKRTAHIPSSKGNTLTGSRRFEEGFNVYQIQIDQKSLCFRASLDHTRFAQSGHLWSHYSLQELMESENRKAEFYRQVRPEQLLSAVVLEFSQEEKEMVGRLWNEVIHA
jgi:hypothetical protein